MLASLGVKLGHAELVDCLRAGMVTDGGLAPPRLGEEQPRGPRA